MYRRTHTHLHTCTGTQAHSRARTHTHVRPRAHTNARARAHTHMHTFSLTHTTQYSICPSCCTFVSKALSLAISLALPHTCTHAYVDCALIHIFRGFFFDSGVNCTIFLGPIKGSLFIRDCANCRVIASCQQFRTRDCKHVEVLLHTTTLPIIEATSAITFGCFRGSYFQLTGQFKSSGLTQYTNYWHQIHDFTKVIGGREPQTTLF